MADNRPCDVCGKHRSEHTPDCDGWGVETKEPPKAEPRKLDAGKATPSLIPPHEMLDLAQLFAFGATKYQRDNWRANDGLAWSRIYDAMMRHALAFWGGEEYDEESGASHMIAVAFGAIVLAHYQKHFRAMDDRWRTDAEG